MKRPTKPPLPPQPAPSERGNRGNYEDPPSGRARKDVAYTPSQGMPAVGPASVRSASPLRSTPPLPSSRMRQAEEEEPYDLLEDLATPTRNPNEVGPPSQRGPMPMPRSTPYPSGIHAQQQYQQPQPEWSTGPLAPLQTGPMPALQQPPMPPPSNRGNTGHGVSYLPQQPPPSQQYVAPQTYPSSQSVPVAGQHITGPQMQAMQRPTYSTGSYPTGPGQPPSSARARPVDDGVPLGYVVASAFFLAIALVGFGLYLAFEVF